MMHVIRPKMDIWFVYRIGQAFLLFIVVLGDFCVYADGTLDRIVFMSERLDMTGRDMFLVDGLGGEPVQIKLDNPLISYPSLTSDGKEIVFYLFPNIVRMSVETLKIEQLYSKTDRETNYSQLALSPDNSMIAFLKSKEDNPIATTICILSIKDHQVREMTVPSEKMHPKWSPASNEIVYSERNSSTDKFDLCVLNIVSGKISNITKTPNIQEMMPVWIDNQRIAFMDGLLSPNIFVMNKDGSERIQKLSIEPGVSMQDSIYDWVWAPDCSQFLLTRATREDYPPYSIHYKTLLVNVAGGTSALWMDNSYVIGWAKIGDILDAKK